MTLRIISLCFCRQTDSASLHFKKWSVLSHVLFFCHFLKISAKKCAENLAVWDNFVTHTHTHTHTLSLSLLIKIRSFARTIYVLFSQKTNSSREKKLSAGLVRVRIIPSFALSGYNRFRVVAKSFVETLSGSTRARYPASWEMPNAIPDGVDIPFCQRRIMNI